MLERFAGSTLRVLLLAQEQAHQLGHGEIGTEHLLLGLVGCGGTGVDTILRQNGLKFNSCRKQITLCILCIIDS